MKAANWYGLGVVLLVLAFVDLVFFSYQDHAFYGLQVAIWGVVCFVMGVRADVIPKR
ncbi:MAG: hypothetical protein Kow0074_25620 [Candidatus Zixiibacteriota bacterium]